MLQWFASLVCGVFMLYVLLLVLWWAVEALAPFHYMRHRAPLLILSVGH